MLAEPTRLRVVAALALGAGRSTTSRRCPELDPREVAAALRRLESAGLVSAEKGELRLHEELFKSSARAAAPDRRRAPRCRPTRPPRRCCGPSSGTGGSPPSRCARAKRRLLLEHVAGGFEPGVRYPEREVDDLLRAWYDDYAALRRYLVDELLLDREDGDVLADRRPSWTTRRRRWRPAAQRVAAYGLVHDGDGGCC